MTNGTVDLEAVIGRFVADRNSPVPLYYQVAEHLESAIASGEIPNGALFANEIQMAERLGLSRPTMRSAMSRLVDRGIVVRRRGIGTRVVQPKMRRAMELSSLHEDMVRAGQSPTTAVLEFAMGPADAVVAEHLAVAVGAPVARLVRLRSAGGTPIALLTNHLPERLVAEWEPGDLEARGLYDLLRSRGTQLHSASQLVGATTATAAQARSLDERRGAALLTMQRTTYDDGGAVVEFGQHLYAASRYSFETHLLAP